VSFINFVLSCNYFFFCKYVFCKLYTARLILFPFLLGEAKQKAFAPADGRNRRVLQDIGNLVNDRVSLQGKVS
jgi:hypothetical protein